MDCFSSLASRNIPYIYLSVNVSLEHCGLTVCGGVWRAIQPVSGHIMYSNHPIFTLFTHLGFRSSHSLGGWLLMVPAIVSGKVQVVITPR